MVLVVASGFVFVLFIVVVRLAGTSLSPMQAAVMRYALGIVVLAPALFRRGWPVLHTRRPGLHALRGAVHGVGVLLWFYAITTLSIAEATALGYTAPIFVTIGAAVFLGERLRPMTVLALVIGFSGVLVIVRPGLVEVGPGAIAILCAAPLFAASQLLVKTLVREDSSVTTTFYLSVFATLTMLLPSLPGWRAPSLTDVTLLSLAAVFATLSHVFLAHGLRYIDVSLAQPVDFLRLVWSAAFGFLLFQEVPGAWVWVGAAVVVCGAWLSARSALRSPGRDGGR